MVAGSGYNIFTPKNVTPQVQPNQQNFITSMSQFTDPYDPNRRLAADSIREYAGSHNGSIAGWSFAIPGSSPAGLMTNNSTQGQVAGVPPAANHTPQMPDGPWNGSAPTQASIADSYQQIQGLLPQYKEIAGIDTSLVPQYQEISSLSNPFDDNYYNNIAGAASQRLQDSYFNNPDSLAARQKNQMNKRGLIGSGIEVGATNDLYKNFGNEMAQLSSDLAKQRVDSQYQVETKNREIQGQNISNRNNLAEMGIGLAGKNKEIESQNIQNQNALAQLGLGAAADQARTTNDFNTKMYGSNVDIYKAKADEYKNAMDAYQNLINNNNLNAENKQQWITQLNAMAEGLAGGRYY